MTMAHQTADLVLTEYLKGASTPHVLLHIGNPGADGTANIAQKPSAGGNIVCKAISFGAIGNHASNNERRVLSDASVTYAGTDIAASQEITHFTIWSALTAGTLRFASAVTTPKTTGSDGVTIAIGDLEVAITVFVKPA